MRWENEPVQAAVIFGSAVDDPAGARDIEIAAKHKVLYEEKPGCFDEIWSALIRMYWDGEKYRTRRKRLIEEALRNVS